MKTVILAGGIGTRISEESHLKPKPMIEIGGKPILWHIMKTFAHFGHKDFYVALGYKACLLYTSPSPRDLSTSRMPSSA